MSPSYGDKLVELQEAMQELQMLKQIHGTDKLQKLQEKKIYSIQEEIQRMNHDINLNPVDAILPYKCRTCPEFISDDERLECYDKNHESCERNDDSLVPLKMSIIKITLLFFSVLMVLLLFLLLTNIFGKYFLNLGIIFIGASVLTAVTCLIFRKPMARILKKLE